LTTELTLKKELEVFEIPCWGRNYISPEERDLRANFKKLEEELNILHKKINLR
jgi:hypothetical protein